MQQGLLVTLGRALALCLLAAPAAPAQDAAAPQPKPDKVVVQVVYKKDAKPAYLDVPGCAWYAWFGSTPAAAARAASTSEERDRTFV